MSERIYGWLLALYPRQFRETYGDEALQLFRDRSREEKRPFARLQLWMDLLFDLASSVITERRRASAPAVRATLNEAQYCIPTFHLVGSEAPSTGSLVSAGLMSMASLGLILFFAGQREGHGSSSAIRAFQPLLKRSESTEKGQLDASERQRVIDAVIKNLRLYYFDPKVAQTVADALRAHQTKGDYNALIDGEAFAALLTRQMREMSHDMHLDLVYAEETLPSGSPTQSAEEEARYRKWLEQTNCFFEKVEVLPHNIGYLKLNAFAEIPTCGPTASKAMASLNHADAIIFDLRDNRGGDREMVALIASYLFDHPEFLYDPRVNPTLHSWMQPRPGNKLADKSAYVLTSHTTASAAEQFVYNLKMLKRATLVGETTKGNAHAGTFFRLDDHFGMGVPRVKALNPFSENDWEGTGVTPDVTVKAADALGAAEGLAESNLKRRH